MNNPITPPPPTRFMWADEIEVNYAPRQEGDSMSLSDGEIIIDALIAHRHKAAEELAWLFKKMVEEDLHNPKALQKTLERDCRNALNVINCCNLYTELITSGAMSDVRKTAAQYPDLVDKTTG